MAKLRIEPREEGYTRGQEIHETILRTSFDILVDQGMDALTFGNIAKRMGTKSQNVTYYFPNKNILLSELLNCISSNYEYEVDIIEKNKSMSDEEKFKSIAELIILDLATKETTRVFPELWAKSNHDSFVQDRLNDLYRRGRQVTVQLVSRLRPDIPADIQQMIGVIAAGCFEGLTIFAGHGKEWEDKIEIIARLTKNILFEGIMSLPVHANNIDGK